MYRVVFSPEGFSARLLTISFNVNRCKLKHASYSSVSTITKALYLKRSKLVASVGRRMMVDRAIYTEVLNVIHSVFATGCDDDTTD